MQVAKLITTSVTGLALAFSMLASTLPAAAATPGFHAAYFSESDFLARSPGQTGQFAVGYTNTGDQAWVKGAAGQQANLGTAAPLNNTTDFTAGWASGWLSANRYAAQDAALVAPGQIGFFIYNFVVPTNAPAGEHRFYGRPVIDGVTWMEDYGYYQSAVVQAGSVLITSTVPASPSTVNQPVVNGTGATASSTVTIFDGTTSVGTGTADSAGAFAITTSVLAEGCHTLSASSTGPVSGQTAASGNTLTYCVDRTAPTVASATGPNGGTIIVGFSEAVNSSSTAGSGAANPANYNLASYGGTLDTCAGTTIAASTDKTTYTISLGAACQMASPSGQTLTVSNVADTAGNVMTAQAIAFTVNDTTGPAISSASASAPTGGTTNTVTVTWNEPVTCVGAYSVDGVTATAVAAGSTSSKCTITSAQTLTQGTTHTVTSTNEKDTVGNTQSPNPASATFTVSAASATITATGATTTQTTGTVTFSGSVAAVSTGTYTVQTPNGTVVYSGAGTTNATDDTMVDLAYGTDVFTVSGCNTSGQTTCALTFTVTGETGAAGETQSPPSQVLTATATQDNLGPTLTGVTQSDTTQMVFNAVWSEPVTAPQACVTTTCPIRIKSGSTIIASTAAADGGILLVATGTGTDNKTLLTAASAIPGGAYTLTAGAGVVLDLSPQANPNLAASIPMAVTDTTRPTVTGAPAGTDCTAGNPCKTFTFTYSEKMKTSGTGSVIDTSHYTLNGAPVSGTASVDSTGTIVTLVLTANAPAGANQFQITGVTDTSGNLINPNPTLINFTRVP